MMSVPVMSEGIRSGVNWIRRKSICKALRDGLGHQRLAQAGHAEHEHMPAAEQRRQQQVQDVVLTDHDLGDLAVRSWSRACLSRWTAWTSSSGPARATVARVSCHRCLLAGLDASLENSRGPICRGTINALTLEMTVRRASVPSPVSRSPAFAAGPALSRDVPCPCDRRCHPAGHVRWPTVGPSETAIRRPRSSGERPPRPKPCHRGPGPVFRFPPADLGQSVGKFGLVGLLVCHVAVITIRPGVERAGQRTPPRPPS